MRNVSCFLVRNLGRFLIVKSQPNLNTFNQLTTFPKVGFVDLILCHRIPISRILYKIALDSYLR